MIHLFSKIRRSILSANNPAFNKLGKYLVYAVGEIVLVVIGILIALSVNNWNDERKEAKAEQLYYQGLLNDLELNKKLVDKFIADGDKRIEVGKSILLDLEHERRDKNYLLNHFLIAIRGNVFVPRDVTYKDLMASGNMNLIKDGELKNQIIQFHNELENVLAQIRQNRDEKVAENFSMVNSSLEFGSYEFDYVKNSLGPEIYHFLPNEDWIHHKNSASYKKFQSVLIFNIAMGEREKQHLLTIKKLIEPLYTMLQKKCNEDLE